MGFSVRLQAASVPGSISLLPGLMSPRLKITIQTPHDLWCERDPEALVAPPKRRGVCEDWAGPQHLTLNYRKSGRGKVRERQCPWQGPHEWVFRLLLCQGASWRGVQLPSDFHSALGAWLCPRAGGSCLQSDKCPLWAHGSHGSRSVTNTDVLPKSMEQVPAPLNQHRENERKATWKSGQTLKPSVCVSSPLKWDTTLGSKKWRGVSVHSGNSRWNHLNIYSERVMGKKQWEVKTLQ